MCHTMCALPRLRTFLLLTSVVFLTSGHVASSRADHDALLEHVHASQKTWELNQDSRYDACTDTNKNNHRISELHRIRKRRQAAEPNFESSAYGSAIYFRGKGDSLLLRPEVEIEIPQNAFSVEFWMRPEGGQHQRVAVVGVFDKCNPTLRERGWSVGLESQEERQSSLYFSLHGDRSNTPSVATSVRPYDVDRWIHVTAVFTGTRMLLYVDGAKVATAHGQFGPLFNHHSLACKELLVGGDYMSEHIYRGTIDELRLYDHARSHQDVRSALAGYTTPDGVSEAVLYEPFSSLLLWDTPLNLEPLSLPSSINHGRHDIELAPSPCGVTVCDDPDVIRAYRGTANHRSQKTIRYQVVNVYSTDGDYPTVTQDQLDRQHEALNAAFGPYNISWERSVVEVRNSSLRERTILLYCEPDKVGNGECNPECQHERTGQDGGDCDDDDDDDDREACDVQKGDGHCDLECNRKKHDWDGGDCCDLNATDIALTCFDPDSPNRAFLSIEEYKSQLGFASDEQLNIFFAEWTIDSLIGLATFPWEKEIFSVLGGTVVRPDSFGHLGKTDNLVHEIGHNLGLWHVHHGITEIESCDDPCMEVEPSLELGDLCLDTAPTPINQQCRDPLPEELRTGTCGMTEFVNTPFNNYMSYAANNCTSEFSADQTARMHCYLDLKYQPWLINPAPPPIPVPPRVIESSLDSVTFVWAHPLSRLMLGSGQSCNNCQEDFSLVQYGHTAWTPNQSPDKQFGAPHQATGPPDATSCGFYGHAWLPEMTSCVEGPCFIEIGLEHAVIPAKLSIWVTWNAEDAIDDVELLYTDGSVESLGSLPAQCDQPITMRLHAQLPMNTIRIHLKKPFVAIDAVEVTSVVGHDQCSHCLPQQYAVTRQPAFGDSDIMVTVNQAMYTDQTVEVGYEYTYRVQSIVGEEASGWSPPLVYTHGQHYCGDGSVDSDLGEECDDGNAVYGDGCDISCQLEEFFRCAGEPSHCYKHVGDGICEPFERTNNMLDCGFYTPEGSHDQWAVTVSVKPGYLNRNCPPDVVIGPPSVEHTCQKNEPRAETEWYNCGVHNTVRPPWIQVEFPEARSCTAVLLYMSASESTYSDSDALIHLELIDAEDTAHPLGQQTIPVTCALTPMHIAVPADHYGAQNRIKGVRIYVYSSDVGIAAVALRTDTLLDIFGPAACDEDEVYNPRTTQCVTSSVSLCNPLLIKHGAVECSGLQAGDTCIVACGQGYELPTHHNTATCVEGIWESRANLTCQPHDCGVPEVAYARVDCPHGTTYGKLCKFECRSPAERRGTNNVLSCEADGLWSLAESYCHILCPELPLVKDAELVTSGCLESGLPVGAKCHYQCHRGFHTHGLTPLDRTLRYSCLASGQWEGPTCERTRCPTHDVIYMGLYSCTDGYYVDSQCTLKCPGPNRVTSVVTCGSDGQWDAEFVACKFQPGQCPILQNTGVLNLGWTSRNIGDEASVSCMFPNSDAVLRQVSKRSVRFAGHRQQSPVLTRLICTGSLNWFPDPVDVTCVEQCNTAFLGDGYCDPSNNRDHCGWDSGDCCASTVPGGVVRTFPETCLLECDCKDPDAEENFVRRELALEVERQRKRFYSLHVDRSKLDRS